ncbi:MAG: sodium-dependent transporter, partial [Novibacillus thermophilus]
VEVILLSWFYKLATFRDHINELSDLRIGGWWDVCLKYVTPIVLIVMGGMNVYNEIVEGPYGGYPFGQVAIAGYAVAIGVIIVGFIFQNMKWRSEGAMDT